MSTPIELPSTAISQAQSHAQEDVADILDMALDALDQRDLLEPALLVSAGYLALPFLSKQVLLLLAPIGALLGFSLQGQEDAHDLPT